MASNQTDESKCFAKHAPLQGPPLIQNGELKFQAHHVGWIIAGFFTLIACGVSFWLIDKHLIWYTKKNEQRQIIRILFLVPIYAIVSLLAFVFWNHSIPIILIRDSYESFVLHAFFYLLLEYVSPSIEGQKEVFRHVILDKWMWPMGFVKYRPRDGLYFLQLMKWGILQYSVLRPVTTLAAVGLNFFGLYCEDSWGLGWGHIWITLIVSISVTIAMYCLLQLYAPLSGRLASHRPLLKLISIKAVVFLTFWQATGLSVLTMFGFVKDTPYMTADDINTGIASLLETFEMCIFAFLHVRAFTYKVYRPVLHSKDDQTPRLKSLMHAMDVRDLWKEIRNGWIYMWRKMRGKEPEKEARNRIHFSQVMGKDRRLTEIQPIPNKSDKSEKEAQGEEEEDDDQRQLLNETEGRTRYERTRVWISETGDVGGDFEDEVVQELRRREVDLDWEQENDPGVGHRRGKRSWWRGIYERVSQTGQERDLEEPMRRGTSVAKKRGKRVISESDEPTLPSFDLDSPPPAPSVIYEYPATPDGYSTIRRSPPRYKAKQSSKVPTGPPVTRPAASHQKARRSADITNLPSARDNPRKSKDMFSLPIHVTPETPDSTLIARDSRNQAERIIVPQPVPETRHRDAERLVSQSRRPVASPLPMAQTNNLLTAPPPFSRSDSLLGRIFPDIVSTEACTAPSSPSQEHTELMYPLSMASAGLHTQSQTAYPQPPAHTDYTRPEQSRHSQPQPAQNSYRAAYQTPVASTTGRPRPNIILPAPLSPARYPRHTEAVVTPDDWHPDPRLPSSTYQPQYHSHPAEPLHSGYSSSPAEPRRLGYTSSPAEPRRSAYNSPLAETRHSANNNPHTERRRSTYTSPSAEMHRAAYSNPPDHPTIQQVNVPVPRIVSDMRSSGEFSPSNSTFSDRYPVLTNPSSSPRRVCHTGGGSPRAGDGRS